MDNQGFRRFLEKAGKREHVVEGLLNQLQVAATFMVNERQAEVDAANERDIRAYADTLAQKETKARMRALMLYYKFVGNASLAKLAGDLREQEVAKTRRTLNLRDIRGISPEHIAGMEARGIKSAVEMLTAGRTRKQRAALAREVGVPLGVILELVKLADLARLPGVKGIRARLYYDAGVDSVERVAAWKPEELRAMLVAYVKRTLFDGIPPLPKEVRSTVANARKLPKIVEE